MTTGQATAADAALMDRALALAQRAVAAGEVPVGAVVALEGQVLGEGWNRRERDGDPTAHAEILALRQAGVARGRWRLRGATLVVTLEPCPMCAGAAVNARLARLVYGCADPKAGAVRSLYRIAEDPRLNHRLEVVPGVGEARCAALLQEFFARLRHGEP